MKRFVSVILCLCLFSSSLMASPEEILGIREAMRELNYALEVEWDQQDPEFYAKQMRLFRERIEKLELNGISRTEALKATLLEIRDGSFKASVSELMKQMNVEEIPQSEIQELFVELASRDRAKGANWIGDVEVYLPIILVAGALIALSAYLIAKNNERDQKQKKELEAFRAKIEQQQKEVRDLIAQGQPGSSQPIPAPSPTLDPTPTPAPTPSYTPTYQCEQRWICYSAPSEIIYDQWTFQPIIGYQDSCGYRGVCGYW